MPDITLPDTTQEASSINNPSASTIRQHKRAQRQALSNNAQQQHSQLLCQTLSKQKSYRNSRHIACYIANDGEIDPQLLIEHARFSGKEIYLPILSPLKNSLYFAPYKTNATLKLNRFNIPEPICPPSQWKTAAQMDLMLLPLVAFDETGNRLGMGSGFYDRTLAYLQHRRFWRKPVLMGLAHEIQKVEQLETQSWDIPLNYIVTEKYLYRC